MKKLLKDNLCYQKSVLRGMKTWSITKMKLTLSISLMRLTILKVLSKKCIKRNEDLVNNKDETDVEYITNAFNNIKSVYEGFCGTCNVEI